MEHPSLSKNLIYHRTRKGISQARLSEISGVTVRTIQRIENGEVNSHLQTVKLLADALDVSVQELIPLENPRDEAIQAKWLLLVHGVPLLGALIPLTNILLPIFIWVHKREDHPMYDRHCRGVINFQITMTLIFTACLIAMITLPFLQLPIGAASFFSVVLLYFAVIAFDVLFIVLNIFRVLANGRFYYPLAIPFFGRNKWSGEKAGT